MPEDIDTVPGGAVYFFDGSVNQDAMTAEAVFIDIQPSGRWVPIFVRCGPDDYAAGREARIEILEPDNSNVVHTLFDTNANTVDNEPFQPVDSGLNGGAGVSEGGVNVIGSGGYIPRHFSLRCTADALAQNEDLTVRATLWIMGGNEATVSVGTNDTITVTTAKWY